MTTLDIAYIALGLAVFQTVLALMRTRYAKQRLDAICSPLRRKDDTDA